MDVDGDGVLSMYELQYFYQEQCQKLEAMAIEPLPFEDCLCQMLDLVRPESPGRLRLFEYTEQACVLLTWVFLLILNSVLTNKSALFSRTVVTS